MYTQEAEVNGQCQKSAVHIKRCRRVYYYADHGCKLNRHHNQASLQVSGREQLRRHVRKSVQIARANLLH